MRKSLLLTAALSLLSSVFCSYPSSYPFENESLDIDVPLEKTPSFTFDDSDPGGYIYHGMYEYTVTEEEVNKGFCWWGSTMCRWHKFVTGSEMSPVQTGALAWNCTVKFITGPETYFDGYAGFKICEVGKCCDFSYGFPNYWESEAETWLYETETSEYEIGLCEAPYHEALFCTIFGQDTMNACTEYWLSIDERLHVYPCYDSLYHYYMGCKLYVLNGYLWEPESEPEAYWDESTASEMNANTAVYRTPDRLCQPYSYYFPELSKDVSGGADTSKSTAVSVESSAESSASSIVFLAAISSGLLV